MEAVERRQALYFTSFLTVSLLLPNLSAVFPSYYLTQPRAMNDKSCIGLALHSDVMGLPLYPAPGGKRDNHLQL